MLKVLCLLVGYRFHDFLYPKLRLPYKDPALNPKEIREKARASAAVAGIFLAFLLALVAALAAAEGADVLDKITPVSCRLAIAGILGALLPYLALREERKISAARWEAIAWQERKGKTGLERQRKEGDLRTRHCALLASWFVLYVTFFVAGPWHSALARALAFSGLFLIGGSLLLLVFSVELYDTAAGWQKLQNTEYHFHMASLASHCYLLGLSMTLVGSALVLSLAHLETGYWLSVVALGLLVAMTRIERDLYNLAP